MVMSKPVLEEKARDKGGRMEFVDLSSQQRRIRERLVTNIEAVLSHGQYINGPEVREWNERLLHMWDQNTLSAVLLAPTRCFCR